MVLKSKIAEKYMLWKEYLLQIKSFSLNALQKMHNHCGVWKQTKLQKWIFISIVMFWIAQSKLVNTQFTAKYGLPATKRSRLRYRLVINLVHK